MIILGVDPGIAHFGWAVIEHDVDKDNIKLVECGLVVTSPTDGDDGRRLRIIYDALRVVFEKYGLDVVAAERAAVGKSFGFGDSVSMAIAVFKLLAADMHRPVVDFTPSYVKKRVTGDGKADKKAIQAAVSAIIEDKTWCKKFRKSDVEHVGDAIAVAISVAKKTVVAPDKKPKRLKLKTRRSLRRA